MKKIKLELCCYDLECVIPFSLTDKRNELFDEKLKEAHQNAKGYIIDASTMGNELANSIRLQFASCIPMDEAKEIFTKLIKDIKQTNP